MVVASSYAIYKQGTLQVVTWLGKTAAQCGYESFRTAGGRSQPGKNSKKKGSKSNKKKGSVHLLPQQPTRYTVSTKELSVLATFIAQNFHLASSRFFKALPRILEVLRDVIFRRKQCAGDFRLPDPTTTTNERHKHFVTVLEEVQQILGGVLNALQLSEGHKSIEAYNDLQSALESTDTPTPAETEAYSSGSVDEKALTNMFAILEIEECTDQEEIDTMPERSPLPSKPPPTVTYVQEEKLDADELFFRIHCFFQDFAKIRSQIRQSWADYMTGEVDLAAVAVTTNTYLVMLQRAERELYNELLEILPEKYNLCSYEKMARLLREEVAISRGIDSDFRQEEGDVINMELQDVADYTCWPVYYILKSLPPKFKAQGTSISGFPIVRPGEHGELDLTGRPLSWRERYIQNKIVLVEILPDFYILQVMKFPVPVLDELSRGLIEMTPSKEISAWVVLGCQIYLDIHETMLSRINVPHKQLQALGQHLSTTIESYFDFSKGLKFNRWKENEKNLQIVKKETDTWVNDDTLTNVLRNIYKQGGLPQSDVRPYSLLSRQPILCGLMLLRLNLRLHEAGMSLVNTWGSLPYVLHLYNAVKHECSKDRFLPWQDLDAIVEIQGKGRIFMGDFPNSTDKYFSRFCLALGCSTSLFAKNLREGKNRQPLDSHIPRCSRCICAKSDVHDVFRGQFLEYKSETSLHTIVDLLKKSAVVQLGKKYTTGKTITNPPPLTTSSLLSSLQTRIQDETPALNIDYFALHYRCMGLLSDINVKLDSDFRQYLLRQNKDNEAQLPFLVGAILLIADGSFRAGEAVMKLEYRKDLGNKTILLKAGDLIRELVEKEGSNELDRVRERVSWR